MRLGNPATASLALALVCVWSASGQSQIGREVAISEHLQDGDEFEIPLPDLIRYGEKLFTANWTVQEGGGRPLTKGTGAPLSNPEKPLVFPRNFNRVSAPDANSCAGCHNHPVPGGAGDIVANVFVLGQRFDFATFGAHSAVPTDDSLDEKGQAVDLQTIANSRATLGMFGSGYVELLAREMTAELQAIRDSLQPGDGAALTAKGVGFGRLNRRTDGTWDVSEVEGIPATSLGTTGDDNPPSLIVRPFHQAGRVISLREFSNNAFNHHHGIQSVERFGAGADPDGDGFEDEMTRADVTAVSIFQATMAVPGRIIPNDPEVEEAVLVGENHFQEIGCAECHRPSLPLSQGALFTEPNPYNVSGNLRVGEAPEFSVDLNRRELPSPRLKAAKDGVVHVPAFTDLKLHDICSGPTDPNGEPLDMNQAAGSDGFFAGNRLFLTRKLWDVAGKPNFFHHGQYTTMREAVLAHAGEALASRQRFEALSEFQQDSVIEFLKTLRVLPAGVNALIVDPKGNPKVWPPARFTGIARLGDSLKISWLGSSGLYQIERLYQLQEKQSLTDSLWENVGEPTSATSLIRPLQEGTGFFRVQILVP